MKEQNMKARVMGGARRCLAQVARKVQDNSDTAALALSVFTMPGPRHCGGVKTTVNSSHQLPGLALVFREAGESIGASPAAVDRLTKRGFRNKSATARIIATVHSQGLSVASAPFFGPKPQDPQPVKGRMVRHWKNGKSQLSRIEAAARGQARFPRRHSARRRGQTSAAHEHGLAVGERTTASHRGKEQI
jgi:hypothetical protein